MSVDILPIDDPQAVSRALEMLARGEIVAFPTDTVYGLGASAFSRAGIERLYEAKIRDPKKAIAVLLGDLDQAPLVSAGFSEAALRLAERFWPGALTLVVTRHPGLPAEISPLPTVGLRIPDHDPVRGLIRRSGPLATTSANLSGGENPLTAQDVFAQLGEQVSLILDGGRTPGGVPSTVVDCTASPLRVVREGPISPAAIRGVAGG